MATILIVEDELLIADGIQQALLRLGHNPLEPVTNSDDVMAVLAHTPVDLVLMDINIDGDMDGVATAILIRRQYGTPVAFLTARNDAATMARAKMAQPKGYLIKPYTEANLQAMIVMALPDKDAPAPTPLADEEPAEPIEPPALLNGNPEVYGSHIFVKKGTAHVRVAITDILYIEAVGNFVRLHTQREAYVFGATMREMEEKLPDTFFKVHRSFLVSLAHVEAYESSGVVVANHYIPVSRSCKHAFKKRIHLLG